MVRLPQVALRDEVAEIPHRGNKLVGEGRHVPHPGAVGLGRHPGRIDGIQGDGLFAEDMLARAPRQWRCRDAGNSGSQ